MVGMRTNDGTTYRADRREVVPSAEVAHVFSAREQRTMRWFGVHECLRLHRAGPTQTGSRTDG